MSPDTLVCIDGATVYPFGQIAGVTYCLHGTPHPERWTVWTLNPPASVRWTVWTHNPPASVRWTAHRQHVTGPLARARVTAATLYAARKGACFQPIGDGPREAVCLLYAPRQGAVED